METNTLLHLKHKIESLLFSAARKISIDEIKKITRSEEEDILKCLHIYKKELEERGSSIKLNNEGRYWQLYVEEKYIPIIKKVVSKTEMPKSIIETLAVTAYKAPVLQSEIIKIRTNKAYNDLNWLEKQSFITREKKGRSKLIRLTPKFYDYFNLDPLQSKEFFDSIKQKKEKEKIEIYKTEPEEKKESLPEQFTPYTEKIGELEIYSEEKTKKKDHSKKTKKEEENKDNQKEEKTDEKENPNAEKEKYVSSGLKITEDQEKKVNEKVKELLGLKKEKDEKNEDEKNE
jgi:segregation and condensation protein B